MVEAPEEVGVEKILDGFVRIVVRILLVLMGIVVLLSVFDLGWLLVRDVVLNPLSLPALPQLLEIFGLFLMVLIGIELLESIRSYVSEHVLRVEALILAALTAIARKIIVLDLSHTEPIVLFGLATLVIALSSGYFLIRRERVSSKNGG